VTTADVLLAALGAVAVGAGAAVVTSHQIVRAGLWLVVALGAVAGVFLVLTAELVAWVQVLIYIGAVVVLLLFAVMLTRAPIGASDDLDRSRWPGAVVGAGAGLGLAALLVDAYRWSTVDLAEGVGARPMGTAIFRTWVLPFELLSVLLLAALVGAIAVSSPWVGRRGGTL
jgi:NADH-quinone oxidoreductase subunit J